MELKAVSQWKPGILKPPFFCSKGSINTEPMWSITSNHLVECTKSACIPWVFCSTKCIWNVSLSAGTECLKPTVPEGLTLSPFQTLYKIGDSIVLTCPRGLVVNGPSRYTCSGDSWTPPILDSLSCEEGNSSGSWDLLRWCPLRLSV